MPPEWNNHLKGAKREPKGRRGLERGSISQFDFSGVTHLIRGRGKEETGVRPANGEKAERREKPKGEVPWGTGIAAFLA